MNGGTEQAQKLTQVRGAAAVRLYLFFSFLFFLFFSVLSCNFICQRG